jgi:hypothetical protein
MGVIYLQKKELISKWFQLWLYKANKIAHTFWDNHQYLHITIGLFFAVFFFWLTGWKENILSQICKFLAKFDHTSEKNWPDFDRFLVLRQVFLPYFLFVLRNFNNLLPSMLKSLLGWSPATTN